MNTIRALLKNRLFLLTMTLAIAIAVGCSQHDGNQMSSTRSKGVQIVANEAEQKVDVLVDGELFTSYLYSDEISVLKKTVLYPLKTANGHAITRAYPLDPKPGERTDHPHHIGFWLNYGDVNGYDFWNNSDAIKPEREPHMGTIRHREIKSMQGGENQGSLEVVMDWLQADGKPILREDTRFVFHAGANRRAVDRITTLTALDEAVSFKDNKEGMIAVRVTRALEHPADKPITLTDASGKATEVEVMDNAGVTGMYTNSHGVTGIEVWGKRAPWVMLSGVVAGENVAVAIFDHPDNVGYPTYWHARGYGLFSANPLGQKIFSEGKEELNFSLDAGASTTFRHRLLILSGETTAEQMEAEYKKFAGDES